MKKFLGLALILFSFVAALAQERVIEKTEFDKPHQTSIRLRADKPYRSIMTLEFWSEGKPEENFVSKTTSKYIPNVGNHIIFEAVLNSKNVRKERIVLGNKLYTREGDEQWKVEIVKPPIFTPIMVKSLSKEVEYRYLGSEMIDNQNTTVYSKTEKTRNLNQTTNKEFFTNITTKYWFKENVELIKIEITNETRSDLMANYSKIIYVYEIDPNIKIEAPILTPNK